MAYLYFISLGLPDALLGTAWPTMYGELGASVSYMGILSMIIAFGTIISSLMSDRLTLKWGTGKETAISVGMTAIALLGFFCYCALEQTTGLWASSYLTLYKEVPGETAPFFASMFFIGITAGQALNGFLTIKCSDRQLIKMEQLIILIGIVAMLLPAGKIFSLTGLILIGLGCAPIYPCVIHSTPVYFGEEYSQALIGVQMASAYIGTCLMPPLFGFLAENISITLLPVYLLVILILMFAMYEAMLRTVNRKGRS